MSVRGVIKTDKVEALMVEEESCGEQTGAIIGELVGMSNEGRTPLVCYPGQPGMAALPARTIIDLHGLYIGRQVVLMLEANAPTKPIIMGILQDDGEWPFDQRPDQVEVDADGERMVVSAKEQLVLRCGKASITMTKAGKIQGNSRNRRQEISD